MDIKEIATEAELVAALSGHKRCLDTDGPVIDERSRFAVVDHAGTEEVLVAIVDHETASKWIEHGHGWGTRYYGPFAGTYHFPEHSGWQTWVPCAGGVLVEGDVIRWREHALDRTSGEKTAIVEIAGKAGMDGRFSERMFFEVEEFFVWQGSVAREHKVRPENGRYIARTLGAQTHDGAMRMEWKDEAARKRKVASPPGGWTWKSVKSGVCSIWQANGGIAKSRRCRSSRG